MSSTSKKFVIIDGKSVFYRGYYAMPNLSTKDGRPTGGVFGFATMALEVIKRLQPDYVAVAWDKPKTNIRRRLKLYPAYKAGRKPAPADFKEQIPLLEELLKYFGWPLYQMDDYEADDIMGSLAVQADKKGLTTLLVTSDLDMLQLVGPSVKVYALKTGLSNIELYSPDTFKAMYGISVKQFLDLKSIKGDSSDNIPGVPGIGQKGALDLLKQYQTLDNVYKNLDKIKPSIKAKLEAGKDQAYLSKELARIWIDAPIKLKLKEIDGSHCQPEALLDFLNRLEFRTLSRQLPEVMQVKIADEPLSQSAYNLSGPKLKLVDKETDLRPLKLTSDPATVYSRAAGNYGQQPIGLVISQNNQVYGFDLTKLKADSLKPILRNLKTVVGYDVKTTLKLLLELGLKPPSVSHDVLIGSFLIDPLIRDNSLSSLARRYLDYDGPEIEDIPNDEFFSVGATATTIINKLQQRQTNELTKLTKVNKLASDIEWPIIPVLAEMEHQGIELDINYLHRFAEQINDLVSDYEQQIYGLADEQFNIASPGQLADILFGKLKLTTAGIKKGKTGYSTAASELEKLRGSHQIIDSIIQYREVAKLKNTYVDSLPKLVDPSSRLHTTYSLTVASTGRLSSSDPNLQNIPTRTDLGKRIRTAFVAGQGNKLISADYSQFELRLAAVLAGDKELIDMFNGGADIHNATAALVYNRSEEDVTKQMRRAAKVINFGILYGMSPHGLSVATGMTRDQAETFIDRYKSVRQPLFDYMDKIKEKARKDGYVESLFGRRRPMPDIKSSNFVVRQAAERAAINMPIQGTEADLMKMAMIKVSQLLSNQHNDCLMLLQIHDSILVQCPAPVASDLAELLKDTLENVYKLPVKLAVDVSLGNNWGAL